MPRFTPEELAAANDWRTRNGEPPLDEHGELVVDPDAQPPVFPAAASYPITLELTTDG